MEFRGKYYFLSNYYQMDMQMEVEGRTYTFPTAFSAFLALRYPQKVDEILEIGPYKAKEASKKWKKYEIPEYRDDEFKKALMEKVVRKKFEDPGLRRKLETVLDEIIYNDLSYNDMFWGCTLTGDKDGHGIGRGKNVLGKILTSLRNEILLEQGKDIPKDPKDDHFLYKVQHGGYVTFDTETTGTSSSYDDIIQITIVGQYGELLLSEYVKPQNCHTWPEAEGINHISPELVSKKGKNPKKISKAVKEIFDAADVIFGHNVEFDIKMVSARFGYDFESKERSVRSYIENQDYVQRLESIRAVIDEACERSQTLPYKKLLESYENNPVKKRIVELFKKKICGNSYEEMKRFKALNEEDYREVLLAVSDDVMEKMTVVDTLNYARHFLEDTEPVIVESDSKKESHKLGTLIKKYFPEKYADMEKGAHNAEVDTLYTALLADYVTNNDRYHIIPKATPVKYSVDNLYGISEGIVCNLVPASLYGVSNFSDRIFRRYPEVESSFRRVVLKGDAYGHINLSKVENSSSKYVANIFAEGDLDLMCRLLAKICDVRSTSNVFVPIVTEKGESSFSVTDGMGVSKNTPWSEIEKKLVSLGKDNLCLLDTQTGEFFPFNKEKGSFVSKDEPGKKVFSAQVSEEPDCCEDIEII